MQLGEEESKIFCCVYYFLKNDWQPARIFKYLTKWPAVERFPIILKIYESFQLLLKVPSIFKNHQAQVAKACLRALRKNCGQLPAKVFKLLKLLPLILEIYESPIFINSIQTGLFSCKKVFFWGGGVKGHRHSKKIFSHVLVAVCKRLSFNTLFFIRTFL